MSLALAAPRASGAAPTAAAVDKGLVVRGEAEDRTSLLRNPEANEAVGVADGELDSGASVKLYHMGDSAQVQLLLPQAGLYHFTARVRAGGKEDPTGFWPGGYRFKVDGQPLALVPDKGSLSALDPSYGGCYWGSMKSEGVTLRSGIHVFEIAANAPWAVADYVEATLVGPPAAGSSGSVLGESALPPSVRIEAEDHMAVARDSGHNGKISVADGTLDSGRSVTLYDAGDAVNLPINVTAAGVYRFDVRLRSGGGTGPTAFWPDGYQVTLDGAPVPAIGVEKSVSDWDTAYGGCNWGTMETSCVVLAPGRHMIGVSAQADWAVLDYVELVAVQPMGPVGAKIARQTPAGVTPAP